MDSWAGDGGVMARRVMYVCVGQFVQTVAAYKTWKTTRHEGWLCALGLVCLLIQRGEWGDCQTLKGFESFFVSASFFCFSLSPAFKHLSWQERLAGRGRVSNLKEIFHPTEDRKSLYLTIFILHPSLLFFSIVCHGQHRLYTHAHTHN